MSEGERPVGVHRRSIRLLLQVSTLFILSVAGLCAYVSLNYAPTVSATAIASTQPKKAVVSAKPKIATTEPQTTAAPVAPPASAPITTVSSPLCTPTSYQLPATLPLSQPGVQQVIDPASNYTVYGLTASQVMSQVARCTPVHSTNGVSGTFAANTAYTINWKAGYTSSSEGLCTLNTIQVGLHINQVFPVWQPSAAAADLATRWQSYISKLHAYENGHVQLDQAAAATVFNDLQNLPPTDCGAIAQAASNKVNADIAINNAANASYDSNNDFGINQGITL
ncbi:MAG TPA: DUF922 domain-containing protein [Verrucomicrobiae bacterium]|nr:DUF922 domain-containing protein [Verrucomicrobiae bacterium]